MSSRLRLAILFGLGGSLISLGSALGLWLFSSSRLESSQPQGKVSLSLAQSYQQALDNGLEKLKQYCQPVVKTPETPQGQPEATPSATLNPNCPNWTLIQPEAKSTLAPQAQASPMALLAWFKRSEPTPSPTPTPQALAPDPTDPAPFPQLHRQARLAKVPIFMYHDILPRKQVFFDVTPQELEAHFQYLKNIGATPISPDALLAHLRLGVPLPKQPVLLSFDDGYGGHYDYVYPLLKKYGYPAVFSVYIDKMKGKTARSSLTWEQLKILAADPLVTIASHTVSHKDLRPLSDDQLFQEVVQSKRILEQQLGIPIKYFTYPEGKMDARVKQWVLAAGYQLAFSMNDNDEHYAGESPDLLTLGRFGQSRLREIAPTAWGGYPAPIATNQFNFSSAIEKRNYTVDGIGILLISGGQPRSIHADSRYQVPEIIKDTPAVAAVDGGFFSLKYLDSNTMIGPILSEQQGFIPGYNGEIGKLKNRPLVLISPQGVAFVPFQAEAHNTLLGIQQAAPALGGTVTDAFVGAAWLVRDNQPQADRSFGDLFDFNAARHRAFWGLNQAGQPVIGVTQDPVGSVRLGQILYKLGFRDAVMLDSGASTSLAYQGESLVAYTPRPVPHVVALFPPQSPANVLAQTEKTK
ncbi:polysaccharide deacetylase family protein [Synechocystis sp. LKSZ1]|uniref:polysaccharide deacetylase family protein n=1 Tax=Synechocystis sp. LKSZ1 TaxID=3144951 RepID=UPI00336BC399